MADATDQISYLMARKSLLCTIIIAPKLAKLQHPTSAELIAPICKPFLSSRKSLIVSPEPMADATEKISYLMAQNSLLCTVIIAPKLAELQHPTSAE